MCFKSSPEGVFPLKKTSLIPKLIFGSSFVISLLFFPLIANAFSENWSENFETYDVGLLSDNEKWSEQASSYYLTTDLETLIWNGIKAGKVENLDGTFRSIFFNPSDDIGEGDEIHYDFYVKPYYWTSNYFSYLEFKFKTIDADWIAVKVENDRFNSNEFYLKTTGYDVNCETGSAGSRGENVRWDNTKSFLKDEWIEIYTETDFENHIIRLNAKSGVDEWEEKCIWFSSDVDEIVEKIELYSFRVKMGFDYFNYWIPEPPPVRVWGIEPESGTIINDLNTNLTIGWEGLENYDGLIISFYNKRTGIHSNALKFETENIGFEGQMVENLQDFQIEKNADWYLHAIAFWETPETYQGMYLTGNWITEYTYDVVSPEYFLKIAVEGFPVIFEMEDWADWYSEHAEQFETPTPLFESVAGLFNPTFSNIGEFGQRITGYFETDKAYARGYELGVSIPMFGYYLTSIEVFFGGLPLIKLFLMSLLLMVGIFLFKIILKFIPFLG